MSITKCPGHMRSLKLNFSATVLTLGLKAKIFENLRLSQAKFWGELRTRATFDRCVAQCRTSRRGNCTISRGSSEKKILQSQTIKNSSNNHDQGMDPNNSDANAPDSWDSLDDPGPGETNEDTSDLNARLHSLNVNAKPFIPNVNAPAFVPSFLKTAASDGKDFLFFLMFVPSAFLW